MKRPARPRPALALTVVGLAVALAGCGGTVDDSTLGTPGSPSAGAGSPASAASSPSSRPSTAAPVPSATASTPAAAQECPLKAVTGPVPAGISTDLTVKPTVAANPAPAPTEVTVADVVVGTGAEATTLSAASVKYVGALYTDGTEFDSSWKTSPDTTFDVTVCANGTVPGFAIAPTGMKVGGRRVVIIPAQYGYGAEGSPPTIPANAALVFVIDLVKVTPPAG